jgi:hypothetical protein
VSEAALPTGGPDGVDAVGVPMRAAASLRACTAGLAEIEPPGQRHSELARDPHGRAMTERTLGRTGLRPTDVEARIIRSRAGRSAQNLTEY